MTYSPSLILIADTIKDGLDIFLWNRLIHIKEYKTY